MLLFLINVNFALQILGIFLRKNKCPNFEAADKRRTRQPNNRTLSPMAIYVPQDGWESSMGDQRALLVRNHRLGANSRNTENENTYNPPLLSIRRISDVESSQAHRSYFTSDPGYYFSRNKMAEEYRPMTDQERADMDLEINRIRAGELGWILGGIPLDASFAERIALRQQSGLYDPLARFRPRREASSQPPDASSSFSRPPEPVPMYQGTTTSVALVQVIWLPPKTMRRHY
jgi:hypothetical protein